MTHHFVAVRGRTGGRRRVTFPLTTLNGKVSALAAFDPIRLSTAVCPGSGSQRKQTSA
jgi:hypothetical protein